MSTNVESVIVDTLNSLNPRCTSSSFAAIARIHSRPRVEAGLSGREPFDGQTCLKYLAVAKRMKSLSESVELPLDWSECEKIRAALDAIDDGTLRVVVIRNEPAAIENNEPLFNVFLGTQYFLGRRRTVLDRFEILSTAYPGQAPSMTESCAKEIVAALAKLELRGRLIPCKTKNEDNYFSDFDAVWRIR